MSVINDYLMRQRMIQRLTGRWTTVHGEVPEILWLPIPRIQCRDGFSVSVQAGRFSYCTPQVSQLGPWTEVECGYPSQLVPEWDEYRDSEVFGYVPVELVEQVIMKHGGIKEICMKRLFMLRKRRRGAVVTDDKGEPLYFADKMEAKKVRDAMGGETVVSLGPDHWRRNESE
jgi:hypothetical protein